MSIFIYRTSHLVNTLSLHDALPIWGHCARGQRGVLWRLPAVKRDHSRARPVAAWSRVVSFHCRSEEHTSELQSRENLVCRLLLEKKKKYNLKIYKKIIKKPKRLKN